MRLVERLERLTLLNAHQIARFLFDIPNLHMRQQLQRRAVAVLDAPRAARNSAHPAGGAPEKTNQPVGLAQRKSF